MSKDTNFIGQPVYVQLLNLVNRERIKKISSRGGHDRYVKKLDGYTHFVSFLFAVLMRFDTRLTHERVCYVTKMKKNLTFRTLSSTTLVTHGGLVEMTVSMVQFAKDDVVHTARMIEFWNEDGKHATLLTNNFDLAEQEIIDIYDNRWQIELLFKQLKQNFPLKYFYGESVNAIESQIWVCLIANLLLTVVNRKVKRRWAFSNLVTAVRQMLMYYVDIFSFLENPERT